MVQSKASEEKKAYLQVRGPSSFYRARRAASKRLRFYRYPPPRHEHEYKLSETPFLPTLTLGAFIEERPELLYYPDDDDKLKEGSRSGSVVSCLSEKASPFSSQPTTPGSEEAIDPRTLEPLSNSIRQAAQPGSQMFMEGHSLEYSLDEQIREKPHVRGLSRRLIYPRSKFRNPTVMWPSSWLRSSNLQVRLKSSRYHSTIRKIQSTPRQALPTAKKLKT